MCTWTVLHRAIFTLWLQATCQQRTHRHSQNHYFSVSHWLEGYTTSVGCFSFPQTRKQLQNWFKYKRSKAITTSLYTIPAHSKQFIIWQCHNSLLTGIPRIAMWTQPIFTTGIFCWFTNHDFLAETGISFHNCDKLSPVIAYSDTVTIVFNVVIQSNLLFHRGQIL